MTPVSFQTTSSFPATDEGKRGEEGGESPPSVDFFDVFISRKKKKEREIARKGRGKGMLAVVARLFFPAASRAIEGKKKRKGEREGRVNECSLLVPSLGLRERNRRKDYRERGERERGDLFDAS